MMRSLFAVVVAAIGPLLGGATAGAAEPAPLDFLRVHVPHGRLEDLPLGDGRYVPMTTAEFEAAVAACDRAGAPGAEGPRPLADRSRYDLSIDAAGRLAGRVTFEVGAAVRPLGEIGLGAVRVERCAVRTAVGTGEAVVFGRADGSMAVRAVDSGTYSCDLSVAPIRPGARRFVLPLVPALATELVVRPPAGLQPRVLGPPARRMLVERRADGASRIEFGPAAGVELGFADAAPAIPLVATWSDVRVRGGGVEVAAALVPRSAWTAGDWRLGTHPDLRVTAVEVAADGRAIDWTMVDDGTMVVRLGDADAGGRDAIVVRGVAAVGDRSRWRVPTVQPEAAVWAGGGTRIEIDPAWAVTGVEAEQWLAVTPEAAGRWPLPARGGRTDADATGMRAAVLHFEQQAAAGAITLALGRRQPQFDVARVTTVGLSPGQVLGRAVCDIRLVTGEAFTVRGRVMPGWIIDGVDLLEPADLDADGDEQPRGGVEADWRLEAGPTLVVDVAVAATPRRSLGLRITGHRRGVPAGGTFRTADMDMVRFAGEAADAAVIDFNLGPEAVVEIDGLPVGILDVPPRLARLAEPGTLRGRIPGGQRAADREARLVQRRPPLDARIDVALAARDERLAESFTLTCRPEAAAVDSLVVHFSEPMGDALEWSLLEPADGSLVARRLDPLDTARGEGARMAGCAESWLVDITPAFLGEVRLRAARDLPFGGPQPVPLAWVEGAAASVGTVTLADTGPARPTIRNRRLRELPPAAGAAGGPVALAEFAFPRSMAAADGGPAAEIVPAAGADARAWAWREALTCRCHESGRAECESAFDIENHGRDAVSLTVLPGRRVEAVLVDGRPAPVESLDGGVTARIPLPAQTRRVRLVVRTVSAADPWSGSWVVDPVGCTVNVPVLDQRVEMQLPPRLEIGAVLSGYREADRPPSGVVERLFAAGRRSMAGDERLAQGAPAADALAAGFRLRRFVPVADRSGAGEFLVVRRSLVTAVCLAVGCLTCLLTLVLAHRLAGAGVLLAAAAALLALWLEPPAAGVARAAWWGALAAGVIAGLASRRTVRRQVVVSLLMAVCAFPAVVGTARAGDDPAPLQVFLTPGDDGGMAFVPEPLYGVLARQSGPAAASARVGGCRIVVDHEAWLEPWRLVLDVDADAGGTLLLDQGADGGRWQAPPSGDDTLTVSPDGRIARAVMPVSGRRRLELRVVPALERGGAVESAFIRLPPAPAARLELVAADGAAVTVAADAVQCDRGLRSAPFLRAAELPAAAGFDLAGAERVRLVRPTDRRRRLAAAAAAATSVNEIAWDLAACRLRSRCTILGESIVRDVVVTATPTLEPVAEAVPRGVTLTPLGGGRHLVAWADPAPGPTGLELEWRMPLADPVGTFGVPGAWLEDAAGDDRTVRLVASPDLVAAFDPTPGAAFEPPTESGEPGGDVRRYATGGAETGGGPELLAVRRRPQRPRGSQALSVGFADDAVTLRLQARIDATSTPLLRIPIAVPPGCRIERVTVRADELGADEAVERLPLDVQWSLDGPRSLQVFVQHPRAGRYRLDVEGSMPPPAARGDVPLMRAQLDGDTPLSVSWSRRGGSSTKTVEVAPDGDAPRYEPDEEPTTAAVPPDTAASPPPAAGVGAEAAVGDRVEQARIRIAIDDRGRLRGLARFDVVTSRPVVRLRMPARTRLFDVLVDGREALARPVTTETWELPIQEAAWPRSLLLVFTGDLGAPAALRQAFRLEPPVVEDLPCGEILWEVDPPADTSLRIAPPARSLSGAAWDGAVAAARSRVADAFTLALATDAGPDAVRLREFAADRAAGRGTAVEEAWQRAIEPADARPSWTARGDGEGLLVRIVPDRQPQAPMRAATSAVLAAVAAASWLVARRHEARWRIVRRWAGAAVPWLLCGGGLAWIATLVPVMPGWLLLLAGVAAFAADARPTVDARVVAADGASTRSLPAG